ncbi:MAG: patatin-like phospholipase family protein [Chloroflexi bacterium]|nr:patatin-like phospholipase family protein [Chloroflexota bacterium]
MKSLILNLLVTVILPVLLLLAIPIVLLLLVGGLLLTALYWLWYALTFWREPVKTTSPIPEIPDAQSLLSEVSLRQLLGSEDSGKTVDGVFEGGGVKAIAQIGAAHAVERLGLKWDVLGGTSGGAIVASLLAAKKSPEQIWSILVDEELHSIVDVWYLPKIASLQKRLYLLAPLLPHFFFTRGLVSGHRFEELMRTSLGEKDAKGKIKELRFKDLKNRQYETDEKESPYMLKMVATDVSRGTPVVLPDDLPFYWESWEEAAQNEPDKVLSRHDATDWWPVAKAVRMSMSIPFFFEPVKLHLNVVTRDGVEEISDSERGRKGKEVIIVDGGITSNFPIWLFDRLDKVPPWPTFGFLLDETRGVAGGRAVRSIFTYLGMVSAIFKASSGAMDKRLSAHDEYRTARLKTLKVRTTQFGLSEEKQGQLFQAGFEDAIHKFKEFSWTEYLDEFRRKS